MEVKYEKYSKKLEAEIGALSGNMKIAKKRKGFKGEAGEFVGRVRLRQEVKGKNYVVCDILGPWEQDKLKAGDVLFAD